MPPDVVDNADESQIDEHGRELIAHRHRFPANLLGFLLAPIVWILHFVALYAVQGVGCALGYDAIPLLGTDVLHLALGAVTIVAAGALIITGVASYRAWRRLLAAVEDAQRVMHGRAVFLAYGALLQAALFLVAVFWSGIPVLLLDACNVTA